jgi:drug/metabolite transporter (DMT)-like permease
MKTGWVVLIAVLGVVAGFLAGNYYGDLTGALSGALTAVCYTADAAVAEGYMTAEQKDEFLRRLTTRHQEAWKDLELEGDLSTLCRDVTAPE